MGDDDILALYDAELRRHPPPPEAGFRLESTQWVVRLVGPSPAPSDNCILYSRLDAATADSAIERELAHFASLNHSFEWKLHAHDRPADLEDRLRRHGFAAGSPETVIVRDLADLAPRHQPPPMIDIRRLNPATQLLDFVAVQNAVWNEDQAWLGQALALESAADAAGTEILVAYAEARPVATSYMRLHRGTQFGSLWGAATLQAFRRCGIYSAMVERHVSTAGAAGVRLLTVDANENSRPILAKVGFRPLVTVQGFIWRPGR